MVRGLGHETNFEVCILKLIEGMDVIFNIFCT